MMSYSALFPWMAVIGMHSWQEENIDNWSKWVSLNKGSMKYIFE